MNIEKLVSSNFYSRKSKPNVLVLHMTLGSYYGAVNRLTNSATNVSSHYIIDRMGKIGQIVALDKAAWHAGRINNPSARAKKVLKKYIWGTLQNPNHQTIGIEFATGYDVDRDGKVEEWEKLYTPQQIRQSVLLLLDVIEPELKRIYNEDIVFDYDHIITHKDIAIDKPNLEIQRIIFLNELKEQRKLRVKNPTTTEPITPTVESEPNRITLSAGKTYKVTYEDGKIIFRKIN